MNRIKYNFMVRVRAHKNLFHTSVDLMAGA